MFKGSGVLRLVADDSSPQGGSILGAVYTEIAQHCALLCGISQNADFFSVVFCHRGLLEGQIYIFVCDKERVMNALEFL